MLLEIVHEVKGTSANLDMARLCEVSSELVLALRDPLYDDKQLGKLYKEYEDIFTESKKAVERAHKQAF